MGKEKPKLDTKINVQDLSEFYWLKAELQEFCRRLGIPASGGKIEILHRLEIFLRTGKIEKGPNRSRLKSTWTADQNGPLSMNTRVGENFRCTQEIRTFFESHLDPTFHFSVALQKYIKAHPEITFRQIADEWARLKALKKSGKKESIGSQFEYNQFTRDFFADPQNRGKTRKDCIEAWKEVRSTRGDRKYRPESQ